VEPAGIGVARGTPLLPLPPVGVHDTGVANGIVGIMQLEM
jgi:hypothetical protein